MSITLYHGSPFHFDAADPSRGKSFRDFGVGFYLAENEIDSLSIAVKDSWDGYLYTYEADEELFDDFRVLEFDGFSEEWLRFVYDNRMGVRDVPYDVVIGPTAGGSVNDIFEAARRSNTPYEDIRDLMAREITDTRFGYQWCITNPDVMDYIVKVDEEHITR